MDAPLEGISQGYAAAASVVSFPFLEPLFDDNSWEYLRRHLDSSSQCFVQDSFNGSSIMSNSLVDSSVMCAPAAAQPDCKLQSHVYNCSPSRTCTYTPPPSGQVLQFQYLPSDQPLPHDNILNMVPPPTLVADGVHPVIIPSDVDMSPSVCTFNKPPPAFLNDNSFKFDADTNAMWWKGKQSLQDPHDDFTFSFHHVEAKHKDQAPYDVLYDRPQLTSSPEYMPSSLPSPMTSWLPLLDVSTSATPCGTMSGTASPTYMQRSILFSMAGANSDSAAMEMSSASAPTALLTSNSSVYQGSTPPERGSLTVPASPTPSVNKAASTRRSSCRGTTSKVAFKVKTALLNLHDGFTWKKYGEKKIMQSTFPRSYFKCDEKDRCGCEVLKRTQRCNDKEHVLFTYLGRHNHP